MGLSPRTLRPANTFTPRSITGLALWLDASSPETLYTTDAGAVTPVSSPTEIAGCAGWWDASDVASITQSGGLVSQWNDKSGLAAHASQGTSGSRPTLIDNAINGRSILRFDGGDGLAGNFASSINTGAYSVFAVCKVTSVVTNGRVFSVAGASNDFASGMMIPCCTNGTIVSQLSAYDGTSGQNKGAVDGFTSYAVFSGVVGTSSLTNAANGMRAASASVTFNTAVTRFGIGAPAQGLGSGAGWNGDIAEVIYYSAALSNADRARVEAYLAAKWGISGVHAPATATSDPVGAWLDKSGNARHATQSTAGSRPTISATKQGGRTAVAFASSTRTVASPATVAQYVADATTSPKMFFAWVARPEGGVAGITFGTAPTNPNSSSRVFFASDYGGFGNHIVDFGSIGGARLIGTVGDEENNAGHVYSAYRDGSVVSVRRDGVEILRKTNASGSYTATNGTLSLNTAEAGSSTASWMEFMAYAASLPAASIARLERYLAAKWGITLAPQVSNADAQDWINRVYTNGGTVSASTAAAVNTLCNDLENASLRDRFYRLNLFCGTGLNAALVPLYRGPSLGGTQYGGTTDTNVGPFVSGDYAETGVGGGLTGNGTSKYLNTGFPTNTLADGNRHLAAYAATWPNAAYNAMLGSESTAGISSQFTLGHSVAADKNSFGCFSNTSRIQSSVISGGAFWIGINDAAGSGKLYRNGSQDGSAVVSASTPTASNVFVFAINRASSSSATDLFNGRLSGYSIGLSMTASQAAYYHTAMQAFQTALTRNV